VNPVDTKVRRGLIPIAVQNEENIPCILGWEALCDRLSLHHDAVKGKDAATSHSTASPTYVPYISNEIRNSEK
jgi:hypothetical protein